MDIIPALKRRQGMRSQGEFAQYLGISPSLLSRIYSGERPISAALARRIVELYPELAFLLANYLLREDGLELTA